MIVPSLLTDFENFKRSETLSLSKLTYLKIFSNGGIYEKSLEEFFTLRNSMEDIESPPLAF